MVVSEILFESEAGATANSEVVTLRGSNNKDEATLQVDISAAASVAVKARVSARMGWVTVHTITSSAIVPIARVGQLQLSVTGNTGTVKAELLN